MNRNTVFTNSWVSPIDKLMLWRSSWTKYDTKISNSFLRICYDQLLVTADTKILESFNLHHKIKGIYKEDILILIVNNSKEIRKIKFQIKTNVAQCLQKLGERFPLINHSCKQSIHMINAKYRNIDDILKYALDRKDVMIHTSNVPPVSSNFIKLCLLDPTFPRLVIEAEKTVKNEINKKS